MVPAIFFDRLGLMRFAMALVAASLVAQQKPPEGLGRGWVGEFELAARQLVALAEAIPEDKFRFRPAPGVRSTSEVFMHVAIGNYGFLYQVGVRGGGRYWPEKIDPNAEVSIVAKREVVKWLRDSLDAVREARPKLEGSKPVEFLGNDVTVDDVLLRLLVHNHEHMGQAIAYARMSGVKPPWSGAR